MATEAAHLSGAVDEVMEVGGPHIGSEAEAQADPLAAEAGATASPLTSHLDVLPNDPSTLPKPLPARTQRQPPSLHPPTIPASQIPQLLESRYTQQRLDGLKAVREVGVGEWGLRRIGLLGLGRESGSEGQLVGGVMKDDDEEGQADLGLMRILREEYEREIEELEEELERLEDEEEEEAADDYADEDEQIEEQEIADDHEQSEEDFGPAGEDDLGVDGVEDGDADVDMDAEGEADYDGLGEGEDDHALPVEGEIEYRILDHHDPTQTQAQVPIEEDDDLNQGDIQHPESEAEVKTLHLLLTHLLSLHSLSVTSLGSLHDELKAVLAEEEAEMEEDRSAMERAERGEDRDAQEDEQEGEVKARLRRVEEAIAVLGGMKAKGKKEISALGALMSTHGMPSEVSENRMDVDQAESPAERSRALQEEDEAYEDGNEAEREEDEQDGRKAGADPLAGGGVAKMSLEEIFELVQEELKTAPHAVPSGLNLGVNDNANNNNSTPQTGDPAIPDPSTPLTLPWYTSHHLSRTTKKSLLQALRAARRRLRRSEKMGEGVAGTEMDKRRGKRKRVEVGLEEEEGEGGEDEGEEGEEVGRAVGDLRGFTETVLKVWRETGELLTPADYINPSYPIFGNHYIPQKIFGRARKIGTIEQAVHPKPPSLFDELPPELRRRFMRGRLFDQQRKEEEAQAVRERKEAAAAAAAEAAAEREREKSERKRGRKRKAEKEVEGDESRAARLRESTMAEEGEKKGGRGSGQRGKKRGKYKTKVSAAKKLEEQTGLSGTGTDVDGSQAGKDTAATVAKEAKEAKQRARIARKNDKTKLIRGHVEMILAGQATSYPEPPHGVPTWDLANNQFHTQVPYQIQLERNRLNEVWRDILRRKEGLDATASGNGNQFASDAEMIPDYPSDGPSSYTLQDQHHLPSGSGFPEADQPQHFAQQSNLRDGEWQEGDAGRGDLHLGQEEEAELEQAAAEYFEDEAACENCGRKGTSVWRKIGMTDSSGLKWSYRVCNPCGLHWQKNHVMRPIEKWGDIDEQPRKRKIPTKYDTRPFPTDAGGETEAEIDAGLNFAGGEGDDEDTGGEGNVRTLAGEGPGEGLLGDMVMMNA